MTLDRACHLPERYRRHQTAAFRAIWITAVLAVTSPLAAGAARWYENYGKATKLIDQGGCQPQAISMLEEAIGQRKKSERSARTVSVQVIQYYPYYQLARAQLACGNWSAARAQLSQERGFGEAPAQLLDSFANAIANATPTTQPPPSSSAVAEASPRSTATVSPAPTQPQSDASIRSSALAIQRPAPMAVQPLPSAAAPQATTPQAPQIAVQEGGHAGRGGAPDAPTPSSAIPAAARAPAGVQPEAAPAPPAAADERQLQELQRQKMNARTLLSRFGSGTTSDARLSEAARLLQAALSRAQSLSSSSTGQEVERRTLELEAAGENFEATRTAAVERMAPQQVSVLIDTNVPGARIFVNGRQVAITSDPAAIAKITLELATEIELRATREGFRDAVQRLRPASGQAPIQLVLSPLPPSQPLPWFAISMTALGLLVVAGGVTLTAVLARRPSQEESGLGSAPVGPIAFDRYHIRNPIGRGGIATIYRAIDTSDGKELALKVLDPKWLSDPEMVHKFLSEADALSAIHVRDPQASVPAVYRSGREGDRVAGSPFIALELIAGENLETFLKSRGRLSEYESTGLALQIARTLMGVHEAGIVHRDLTPDNLLLCPEPARLQGLEMQNIPRLVVIDFGVARQEFLGRVTMDGSIAGKPPFMSPEQCRGAKVDARSDLYALGLLIYNMLAGRPPFTGSNPFDVMRAQESQPPPPLDGLCSERLSHLMTELLMKEPSDRPTSAVIVTSRLASHFQALRTNAAPAGALQ